MNYCIVMDREAYREEQAFEMVLDALSRVESMPLWPVRVIFGYRRVKYRERLCLSKRSCTASWNIVTRK